MRKLLVVVDYQKDFVDGALGFEDAVSIRQNVVNKIKEYISNKDDIICTLDTHYDDYLETVEGKNLPIKHCIKGSKGHELDDAIKELVKDYPKLEKLTFASKDLVKYLEDKDYEEIELIGVVSNICVFSNALMCKAALPNSNIVVDSSCCASNDLIMQEKGYDVLRNLHIVVK